LKHYASPAFWEAFGSLDPAVREAARAHFKAVLIILLMLTVIARKAAVNPETTASAQGPFAGVQDAEGSPFF